jgi:hypothetical protein
MACAEAESEVHAITAPIVDADSPNAEQILGTASELVITGGEPSVIRKESP